MTVEQLLRHRGGIPQYRTVTREQVHRYTAAGAPEAQRAAFLVKPIAMLNKAKM